MSQTRREFIKTAVAASVATSLGIWVSPEARAQAKALDKDLKWDKSVCRFCGTGCGVVLGVRNRKLVALRGDPKHPTTKGLVCAKALFLPKIVQSKDRLKYPMIRKGRNFQRARWDDAMSLIAEKFVTAIKQHGPLKGFVLAAKRLLRCHPYHPGGVDPVP